MLILEYKYYPLNRNTRVKIAFRGNKFDELVEFLKILQDGQSKKLTSF